ncbi:MAG TPA: hypothetical protein VFC79_13630, partial [Tissierellaceae bacterium]|nr:hypothetical protein [Tissierellaceae bacterium]
MAKNIENIKIENARIVFRNLSGKPDKFNPQGGKRSFSVVIDDPEFANELKREGWNIKQFNPSPDSDEEPAHFISVKVSYNNIPPHIYLCTSKNKTLLNEDTVGQLDYAEISNVDIVITPYQYEMSGRSGISAYVKTMYVTVVEDEFASKYEYDDLD